MTEKVFDPTVLTKNRDRLMKHEVAELFLVATMDQARRRGLLSSGADFV